MYLHLVNFVSHNSTQRLNECKLFVNIFVVIIFYVINILIVHKSRVWGYLTDEINSPGRTTHNLSEFWLADSFFRWNHVSAWKNNVLMKKCIYAKIEFYHLWLFVNYENWWGGPWDLHHWLYNTFADSTERLLLYLSNKGPKSAFLTVLATLRLQSWPLRYLMPLKPFAECVNKEPCFLFLFHRIIYID